MVPCLGEALGAVGNKKSLLGLGGIGQSDLHGALNTTIIRSRWYLTPATCSREYNKNDPRKK